MTPEVVTMGETMLRFTPEPGQSLEQAETYRVDAGGAESNVAVGLARLGRRTAWISRLPSTPLGRRIASRIGGHDVDVSRVLWVSEGRVGLWFLEPPVRPRPGRAYYDRAGSAFSQIDPDEVDWTFVRSARWLHLTGITLALSANCRLLVHRALDEVAGSPVTVSFDVNYRARLWPPQMAREALEPVLRRAEVIFCPLRDARMVFGETGEAEEVAPRWAQRYGARLVVITAGRAGAAAFDGSLHRMTRHYPVRVIDPVGRGDAFVAGFIGGYLEGGTPTALAWAAALAALKQTYAGDLVWCTREDLLDVLAQEEGIRR